MARLNTERLAAWILFLLIFAMSVRVPLDTDTWWHLRSGQVMVDNGELLREDRFSYTQDGKAWVNHGWGAQLVLYGAYKLTGGGGDTGDSGVIGLALYTAVLATVGMWLLYRISTGSVYSRMFVLVIGSATAAVFWSARPQMFSFLLSCLLLHILYRYKYQQRDYLWFIPLLMLLWVNLHAGFAIAFIFLGAFLVGEILGQVLDKRDENALTWLQIRKLGLITLVSIAALCLNPYGPKMILYAFDTAGIQTLNAFIQEWRSPDFKIPQTWPFLIMLGAVIVLGGRVKRQMAWSELVLVAGTVALALWSARNMAVFAVAATPLLARQLDAWLNERGWQIIPNPEINPRLLRLNWLMLGLVILVAVALIGNTLAPKNVEKIQKKFLPIAAVAYLQDHPPQGALFNEYNWGGYLIFAAPEIPVFVDGRTDLYGDTFLKDYIQAVFGGKTWYKALDTYAIQTVLIPEDGALATLLSQADDEWRRVYRDDVAVIFERQSED